MHARSLIATTVFVASLAALGSGCMIGLGSDNSELDGVEKGDWYCTYTRGFWRNHEEAWPVDELTIGEVTYGQEELLDLLATPTRGDVSVSLSAQLIAAMLNTVDAPLVPEMIDEAQDWMADNKDADGRLPYGVKSSAGDAYAAGVRLVEDLSAFNEGRAGIDHCDDLPEPPEDSDDPPSDQDDPDKPDAPTDCDEPDNDCGESDDTDIVL